MVKKNVLGHIKNKLNGWAKDKYEQRTCLMCILRIAGATGQRQK